MSTQEIIDRLNAYDAEHPPATSGDIWQDVILGLDEYDEAATDKLDGQQANDRFATTDGSVIRYDAQTKSWYEQS